MSIEILLTICPQTFRSLESQSVSDTVTREWRRTGLLHMVLTGMPAATMYLILYHGGSLLLSAVLRRLENSLFERFNLTKHEAKIKAAFKFLRST